MGAVKSWIMDLEEQFEEKAFFKAGECESFAEFVDSMSAHRALVVHLEEQEVVEILHYIWTEKWSKYNG